MYIFNTRKLEIFNFFELFRTFRATAPPAASRIRRKHTKFTFFAGLFNCLVSYAILKPNALRVDFAKYELDRYKYAHRDTECDP